MVDDAIIFGLFDIYMHLLEDDKYMMIDWFLRTENQLHYFLNQIYVNKRDFVWIYFDLPRDIAIERLLVRAKKEWRIDDNVKSIETRLDIYEKETVPVIKYLENRWKLIVVDANKSVEECFSQLIKKLVEKWLV
jgi:adenylate kinase family enzyme